MISNKTLAIFVILGMVFSLSSTLITLTSSSFFGTTGFVTNSNDTGTVRYNISSNVIINLTNDEIDFGHGYATTGTMCIMDSEGFANATNCNDNFIDVTPTVGFVLENIGNKNASLDINFNRNASTFFAVSDGSEFNVKVANATEPGACANLNVSFLSYNVTPVVDVEICDNYGFEDAANQLEIDIQLKINYTQTGASNATMTLTANEYAP